MSKDLAVNTEVVSRGVSRLLFTFQDKPRIVALLSSYLAEVQELRDATYQVWVLRQLQRIIAGTVVPTNDIMNKLGKLVGQPREGFDNVNYAILISARIRANKSTGRTADIIAVTSLLVPGTAIYVQDLPPASIMITPQGAVLFDPYLIGESFLLKAVAAGVYLMFRWTTAPFANTLILGYARGLGAIVPTIDQSPCWSGDLSVGGLLAGLVVGVE